MTKIDLSRLEPGLRYFLASFLFLLSLAVISGLIYVAQGTMLEPVGITRHYAGDAAADLQETDIQENFPKSVSEMLLTTHSHFAGFAFIFFLTGGLFYFTKTPGTRLKTLLMTEPFLTVFLTFASIWGVRFLHPSFSYLVMLSATLTYLSFFVMTGILFYELLVKNRMFSSK